MTFENFDALFQHAKDANLDVAVLTGAFNNLTGKVAGLTPQIVTITAQGATDIYIDRTKIFGAFIPAQEANTAAPDTEMQQGEEPSAQGDDGTVAEQ